MEQQFQVVLMVGLQLKKRINKAYPPQISSDNERLSLYSPLQQWLEVHSSTSLRDIVEIETVPQPLFMNSSDSELTFQSQDALWTKQQHEFELVSFTKRYFSHHSIITPTKRVRGNWMNLTETGVLNIWNSQSSKGRQDQIYLNNPQSFGQISVKQVEESKEGGLEGIQTRLQTESMQKQYKNGFNLANFVTNQDRFYTLHIVDYNNGQSRTKICLSDISDSECENSYFRTTMPAKISTIQAWNDCILAYGGDTLLLTDRRAQATVASLNDLEDSFINFVKRRVQNDSQMFVCRDSYVLLMDIRKPREIVEVVLDAGQDIESFESIKEGDNQFYCVASKYNGNVDFFQISP